MPTMAQKAIHDALGTADQLLGASRPTKVENESKPNQRIQLLNGRTLDLFHAMDRLGTCELCRFPQHHTEATHRVQD